MKLICDIETGPLPRESIAHLCPKFEAPSNYKDADKIAANIAEQEKAWYGRAALHPMTGYIAAIGICSANGLHEKPPIGIGEEADVLRWFWNYYSLEGAVTQFIGHNLHGFDIPFIIRRSWAHGIRVPQTVMSGRYINDRRFVDTMKVFQCGNSSEKFYGLDAVAKFFGLAGKTDPIGATFAEVLASDPKRALAYLEEDLNLTRQVAERMGLV